MGSLQTFVFLENSINLPYFINGKNYRVDRKYPMKNLWKNIYNIGTWDA